MNFFDATVCKIIRYNWSNQNNLNFIFYTVKNWKKLWFWRYFNDFFRTNYKKDFFLNFLSLILLVLNEIYIFYVNSYSWKKHGNKRKSNLKIIENEKLTRSPPVYGTQLCTIKSKVAYAPYLYLIFFCLDWGLFIYKDSHFIYKYVIILYYLFFLTIILFLTAIYVSFIFMIKNIKNQFKISLSFFFI